MSEPKQLGDVIVRDFVHGLSDHGAHGVGSCQRTICTRLRIAVPASVRHATGKLLRMHEDHNEADHWTAIPELAACTDTYCENGRLVLQREAGQYDSSGAIRAVDVRRVVHGMPHPHVGDADTCRIGYCAATWCADADIVKMLAATVRLRETHLKHAFGRGDAHTNFMDMWECIAFDCITQAVEVRRVVANTYNLLQGKTGSPLLQPHPRDVRSEAEQLIAEAVTQPGTSSTRKAERVTDVRVRKAEAHALAAGIHHARLGVRAGTQAHALLLADCRAEICVFLATHNTPGPASMWVAAETVHKRALPQHVGLLRMPTTFGTCMAPACQRDRDAVMRAVLKALDESKGTSQSVVSITGGRMTLTTPTVAEAAAGVTPRPVQVEPDPDRQYVGPFDSHDELGEAVYRNLRKSHDAHLEGERREATHHATMAHTLAIMWAANHIPIFDVSEGDAKQP